MTDGTENLTTRILQGIREDLQGVRDELRSELGGVRQVISILRVETNRRFEALESATIRGFEGVSRELYDVRCELEEVNARLGGIRDIAGGGYRDHEQRIGDLEQRVDRLEGDEED